LAKIFRNSDEDYIDNYFRWSRRCFVFTDLLGGAARRRKRYLQRKTLSPAWPWNARARITQDQL